MYEWVKEKFEKLIQFSRGSEESYRFGGSTEKDAEQNSQTVPEWNPGSTTY